MKKTLLLITLVFAGLNLSAAQTKSEIQQLEAATSIQEFYNIYNDKISETISKLTWEEQLKFQENVYEPTLSKLIKNEVTKITNYSDLKKLRGEFDVLPIDVIVEFKEKAKTLGLQQTYFKDFKEDHRVLLEEKQIK